MESAEKSVVEGFEISGPPHDGAAPARRRLLFPAVMVAILVIGIGVWRPWRNASGPLANGEASKRDAPVLDGNLIRFSAAFAERAGITDVLVASKTLVPEINVTGTVTFDTHKFAAVGARISGRIHQVMKVIGDQVKAGEALAKIESAELGRAESLVLGARAREMAAEAQMKRERRLADAKISAERDAESAKAEFEAARAERTAAETVVQALGGGKGGPVGILVLRSPIAGRIVAAKQARGQTVEPSDTVFEIADLSTLWVELQVYERELASVRVGDFVEVTPTAGAGQTFEGKVAHVGDVIAVSTRSAPVRVVVDNRAGGLRPGQSVHARLRVSAPAAKVLTIPRAAVTRIDGRAKVLLMAGPGAVEVREVTLGSEDSLDVAVEKGLSATDRVVVGGLFALKSEIFR